MTKCIMIDIESLSLSTTDAPILQIAAVPFDSEDTEMTGEIRAFNEFFPLQPQLDLSRKINADTLGWWLDQPREMLARIRRQCLVGNDPEELFALLRALNRKIDSVIDSSGGDYEIWARGPQFDLVAIATLMQACGQTPTWDYNKVRDLRTLMATAWKSSSMKRAGSISPPLLRARPPLARASSPARREHPRSSR